MAKPRKRPEQGGAPQALTAVAPSNHELNQDGQDRIAGRAYELYLARGGSDGGDLEDWLAAERELGSEHGVEPDVE
jgi:hypothetical protein